jgi:hypothetical protein
LNTKQKPNRLLVEEAANDDNSVVALSQVRLMLAMVESNDWTFLVIAGEDG